MLVVTILLGLLYVYGAACLPNVLKSRPLHIVERSSHSLYLLHWPILGMLIYTNSDFGVWWFDYVVYFLLITFLTASTYLFIEQSRYRMQPYHAWIILATFSSLSLIASQLELSQLGYPAEVQTVLETGAYSNECKSCVETPTQPFFVLWDDSHSQMLAEAAAHAAANTGFQLVHIKGSLADSNKQFLQLTSSLLFAGTIMASR